MIALALLAGAVLANRPMVCIDPGHPSETSRGCRGRRLTEVAVVWGLAKLLKAKLESAGVTVILTKSSQDQFVTNKKRAEIANQTGASLMIRLHCDAGPGSGFAVYYPDRAATLQGLTGPSKDVLKESCVAAKAMHQAMAETLRGELLDNGLRTDRETEVGHRQGALTGSVYSRVPVILVEACVLTNPQDERFIGSKRGQTAVVKALFQGVRAALAALGAERRSSARLP